MAPRALGMDAFEIDTQWIDADSDGIRPEFDQTYGSLGIRLDGKWATSFATQSGVRGERLEVPSYSIAEWMAENWWALLFEPKKTDIAEADLGFRSRHWVGTARDGFVLPDLWIYPVGRRTVHITAKSASFVHARTELLTSCEAYGSVSDVTRSLAAFVSKTIKRLKDRGLESTRLQEVWAAFKKLDEDERRFCELMGALGLSPYESHSDIQAQLLAISEGTSERVAAEFCEAAGEADFLEAAADMQHALNALNSEPEIDLARLFGISMPSLPGPAWQLGRQMARRVRESLDIDDTDQHGGQHFFDVFGIDRVVREPGLREMEEPVVHGALRRADTRVRMNLIRKDSSSRRFDAARSCFLAWDQSADGERLVTRARVRDQQASRTFAAELLAPARYIKSRVKNNLLSPYHAATIAEELDVSQTVVLWQAKNNGIVVVGAHGGTWT